MQPTPTLPWEVARRAPGSNIAQAFGPFGNAEGGGIHAFSDVLVSGSLLFNNTALATVTDAEGGGLHAIFDSEVVNTTVSANRALSAADKEARGGGMYISRGSVRQTTFFGNLATDETCASTILDTLDGVGALADNGGPTRTHALLVGSTAIDAAGSCGGATDQRGAGRVGLCDAGAFEVIGCEILELEFLTIALGWTSTTCNTALLGSALIVESGGRLEVTAGWSVTIKNDFVVMAGGELAIGTDPGLLPP